MSNDEIKKYARSKGVRMYELASEFEMNESVLSRMFRCELDEDMKQVIIGAINRLANDKETNGSVSQKMVVTSLMRERVMSKSNVADKSKKSVSSTKTSAVASVETVTTATRTTSKPKGTSKSEDLFDSLFDSFEIEEDVTGGDLYG